MIRRRNSEGDGRWLFGIVDALFRPNDGVSTKPGQLQVRLEREPQGRIRWLEPDEESRLLDACGKSQNRYLLAIVTAALETGMRKGEVLGLAWDRVDFSRGVLRLEVTKSGKRREIPMRQAVYDVLAAPPGPREGRVWPAGNIRKVFENAVEAAGGRRLPLP